MNGKRITRDLIIGSKEKSKKTKTVVKQEIKTSKLRGLSIPRKKRSSKLLSKNKKPRNLSTPPKGDLRNKTKEPLDKKRKKSSSSTSSKRNMVSNINTYSPNIDLSKLRKRLKSYPLSLAKLRQWEDIQQQVDLVSPSKHIIGTALLVLKADQLLIHYSQPEVVNQETKTLKFEWGKVGIDLHPTCEKLMRIRGLDNVLYVRFNSVRNCSNIARNSLIKIQEWEGSLMISRSYSGDVLELSENLSVKSDFGLTLSEEEIDWKPIEHKKNSPNTANNSENNDDNLKKSNSNGDNNNNPNKTQLNKEQFNRDSIKNANKGKGNGKKKENGKGKGKGKETERETEKENERQKVKETETEKDVNWQPINIKKKTDQKIHQKEKLITNDNKKEKKKGAIDQTDKNQNHQKDLINKNKKSNQNQNQNKEIKIKKLHDSNKRNIKNKNQNNINNNKNEIKKGDQKQSINQNLYNQPTNETKIFELDLTDQKRKKKGSVILEINEKAILKMNQQVIELKSKNVRFLMHPKRKLVSCIRIREEYRLYLMSKLAEERTLLATAFLNWQKETIRKLNEENLLNEKQSLKKRLKEMEERSLTIKELKNQKKLQDNEKQRSEKQRSQKKRSQKQTKGKNNKIISNKSPLSNSLNTHKGNKKIKDQKIPKKGKDNNKNDILKKEKQSKENNHQEKKGATSTDPDSNSPPTPDKPSSSFTTTSPTSTSSSLMELEKKPKPTPTSRNKKKKQINKKKNVNTKKKTKKKNNSKRSSDMIKSKFLVVDMKGNKLDTGEIRISLKQINFFLFATIKKGKKKTTFSKSTLFINKTIPNHLKLIIRKNTYLLKFKKKNQSLEIFKAFRKCKLQYEQLQNTSIGNVIKTPRTNRKTTFNDNNDHNKNKNNNNDNQNNSNNNKSKNTSQINNGGNSDDNDNSCSKSLSSSSIISSTDTTSVPSINMSSDSDDIKSNKSDDSAMSDDSSDYEGFELIGQFSEINDSKPPENKNQKNIFQTKILATSYSLLVPKTFVKIEINNNCLIIRPIDENSKNVEIKSILTPKCSILHDKKKKKSMILNIMLDNDEYLVLSFSNSDEILFKNHFENVILLLK
ncbi:bromo adjacent homology domain-containing 1 protein [Anaeramoeba flamelloides]|uniref:Bromo adjacent homology domain-containing 1 protein n=1 Tax=Anaeramoeba flamelloides TaxID=1746091 RepID=A0AAV7ZX38_9EUKA|nr:bromo adjacent homology domain-containing 1 protein [Anaeramoeba flamelloides]